MTPITPTNRISSLSKSPYLTTTVQPLEPLPHPVYFVNTDPRWQDLISNPDFLNHPEQFPLESLYAQCCESHDIWTVQVYLDLKQRGLNVHLVNAPIPGKICFIPYYHLQPKDWLYKSYVIACQYDTPRPALCNHRVVLNSSKVLGKNDHFMPHRPQPNLKPRDQSRGARLENLVFKGRAYNLFEPFRSPEFLAGLDDLGIQFVLNTESSTTAVDDWGDYRDADVSIAIRNSTTFDIALKPAVKLINAWMAGCPALLSPEPACQMLRQSSLDYIEVCTPEDALTALRYLKENPNLYLAMIENGFRRAEEFTVDRTALRWRELLAGPIAEGYEQWLRQSKVQQNIVRPIQYFGQIWKHKQAKKQYLKGINSGPRILTDRDPKLLLQLPTQADAVSLGVYGLAEEKSPSP